MNEILNIQNDRLQELILPEYGSDIRTSGFEDGISAQCTFQQPHSYSSSGCPLKDTYGTHLSCQVMPAPHTQKNTSQGKSVWQSKNKTTPRQQLEQLQQQANNVHPVSGSSAQLTSNFQSSSGNQKLVVIESAQSPSPTTAKSLVFPSRSSPTSNYLSLGHPLRSPILQLNPCIEHQKSNRQAFCIFEGLSASPTPSQAAVPYIVSAAQSKSSAPKSYCTQSVSITNKSQQIHQFRYQQQYSGGRFHQTPPQTKQQMVFQTTTPPSQLVVFRPPPRERAKSPFSQSCVSSDEISKISNKCCTTQEENNKIHSDNTSQHASSQNSSSELQSQVNNMQNPTHFSSTLSSNNADTITAIQSAWLSTQPLGNVHLVMGLATGNALKKSDNVHSLTNKEIYPNPIARPTGTTLLPDFEPITSEENPSQIHQLHSDSSTSFDFSIEAEKMVSALCNSSTVKDFEISDLPNSIDNNETCNSGRKQMGEKENCEVSLKTIDDNALQFEETDKKSNSAMIVNNKDWIMINKASSDDESINSVSTIDFQNPRETINSQSFVESENTNINGFHLRLSPSSNSSSGTAKNYDSRSVKDVCFRDTERNRRSTKSGVESKNVSCQTNILQSVHDEQLMFRKTTVKGCHEINKIIEEYMSPSLEGLSQLCVEVRQAVSKPESLLVSESVQKDLIIEFLRLANCWSNLYPIFGSTNYKIHNLHSISDEVALIYQNWTCASRKLMEEIIKIFQVKLVPEDSKTAHNGNDFVNQDYVGYPVELTQSCYRSCCSASESCKETPIVLTSIPQSVFTEYPIKTALETMRHPYHSTPDQSSCAYQNQKSNWRVRRFSDTQSEITNSCNQANMCKGKPSFQSTKENNKRWNFSSTGSTVSFHSSYGNTVLCDTPSGISQKIDNTGTTSSRASRSDSHISHERLNHNKSKQKTNISGKKGSSSLNIEAQLRDKALETLDGFTKQWQQKQYESLKGNKSLDHKLYIGKMSGDQISSVPKSKMIPLSQIEASSTPQNSAQHIDLSSWFQSFAENKLTDKLEGLYTDKFNHPVPLVDSSQDISEQSCSKSAFQSGRRHSYQESRNQSHSGKGKSWPGKKTNSHSKISPSYNTNINDEHDSSDDPQDRIYMKPGSYDVPKRKPSDAVNRNSTPIVINSNVGSTVLSPTSFGIIVPFPAAPIVPPPTRTMEMNPKILRHVEIPKNQSPTISQSNGVSINSDSVWQKACKSAGSLLETLQSSVSDSPTSPHELDLEEEIGKIVEGDHTDDRADQQDSNERKEKEMSQKITSARRKSNAVKTDHWLMKTLNNVSKLQNDNETQNCTKVEDERLSTTAEAPTEAVKMNSVIQESASVEIQKESETVSSSNVQKCNTPKNIVRRKEGKKEEGHTPKIRKPFAGPSLKKSHQESGKNNADSRKRKLQERSPNEEQTTQIKNDSGTSTAIENSNSEKVQNAPSGNNNASSGNTSSNKPKTDLRNKATWNVWYSSRRRRGLSIIAVNKLEDILNVIWNMEASDFVKYPVSSNDVNDYYKHVKHPMFLETIGYKLKNRIYETIEQFVHDFRRIFLNAKLYNKDDTAFLSLTNALETKFDGLLEDHFSGWEFGHITGDPNETTSIPALRYLAYSEKSTTSKNRRAKASKPVSAINSLKYGASAGNPSSN